MPAILLAMSFVSVGFCLFVLVILLPVFILEFIDTNTDINVDGLLMITTCVYLPGVTYYIFFM